MTLWSYVKVLRKRWISVASLTLLGVLLAVAATLPMPKTYSAQARSFVSITSSGTDINNVYQNGQFALGRISSYTWLVDSPQVLNPVIAKLKLSMSPRELRRNLTATNPVNTVLLNVAYTGTNPAQAAAIANAVSTQLDVVIERIETPRSGGTSPIKVILAVPATTPEYPISPRVKLNVALGLLVGLALGVAVAVLREQLDTTIKSSEDMQGITGATPLALIGFDAAARKNPLLAISTSNPAAVEVFRTLRTNLKFVDVDHPPHLVVVTSAVANEGKTTTSFNLAITLAQSGLSVCLVEADLRRPMVSENLGIEGAVGLTDVVAGVHTLDDALVPWNRGLLTVLPAGTTPSDPSQLLGSKNMETLLRDLRARFDMVIIDAPPLLPVSDAAVVAKAADGALVVARYGRTKRDQLVKALDVLAAVNATVIGNVLNFVPDKGHGYTGQYGYAAKEPPATPIRTETREADTARQV